MIFKFDIALVPQIEINSLDGTSYQRYSVNIADSVVDKEIEELRKKAGAETQVEGTIQDTDMITMTRLNRGFDAGSQAALSIFQPSLILSGDNPVSRIDDLYCCYCFYRRS